VRARRAGGEGGVEVHDAERLVHGEPAVGDGEDAHLVVTLEVDLAEVVLVEEVVGDDEPAVVVREMDRVRACAQPQAHDRALAEAAAVGDVEHPDLPRLVGAEDEPPPAPRHGEQLRHPAARRHLDVRDDRLAVERLHHAAVGRVDGVDEPRDHVRRDRAAVRVAGDELDVHRPRLIGEHGGAHDAPLAEPMLVTRKPPQGSGRKSSVIPEPGARVEKRKRGWRALVMSKKKMSFCPRNRLRSPPQARIRPSAEV
jgi:hypothetical protein